MFKERLIQMDLDNVTPATINNMKTIISTDEAYAHQVRRCSEFAFSLLLYLVEIIEYHEPR